MCDIWKANHEKKELSHETLAQHIHAFRKLRVRKVALSGGEALMHANLWALCRELKSIGAEISLLSTGITLKTFAADVIKHVDDVIVSIDGSEQVHNKIRGLPQAFQKLRDGVDAIRKMNPAFPISGRCVLQKSNFHDLLNIIASARDLGLDRISFLPADVSSTAFNRPTLWGNEKVFEVALNETETAEFERLVRTSFTTFEELFRRKFITESPGKMLDIVRHYRALLGLNEFPEKRCNAPWVSAVIEADGEVRPCFFHGSYGNIHGAGLEDIINSPQAVGFRKRLDVRRDLVCKKCVCSLHVPLLA
jgi:MoaA/NifB/PqqE/SkfB family radical SAM enzyme